MSLRQNWKSSKVNTVSSSEKKVFHKPPPAYNSYDLSRFKYYKMAFRISYNPHKNKASAALQIISKVFEKTRMEFKNSILI